MRLAADLNFGPTVAMKGRPVGTGTLLGVVAADILLCYVFKNNGPLGKSQAEMDSSISFEREDRALPTSPSHAVLFLVLASAGLRTDSRASIRATVVARATALDVSWELGRATSSGKTRWVPRK